MEIVFLGYAGPYSPSTEHMYKRTIVTAKGEAELLLLISLKAMGCPTGDLICPRKSRPCSSNDVCSKDIQKIFKVMTIGLTTCLVQFDRRKTRRVALFRFFDRLKRFSYRLCDGMDSPRLARFVLPLQVAAVCYRRRGNSAEFLLVNTDGGGKWPLPKGNPATAAFQDGLENGPSVTETA